MHISRVFAPQLPNLCKAIDTGPPFIWGAEVVITLFFLGFEQKNESLAIYLQLPYGCFQKIGVPQNGWLK